jgi:hypothetical protein
MTTSAERRSDAGRGEQRLTSFGLPLLVDAGITIPGLAQGSSVALDQPPSRIRVDAEELTRRWEARDAEPVRVREISFEGAVVRSIDFVDSAGYLLWAKDFGRVLISTDGTELLCEPDCTNPDWANIVSSQALPLAATIRGLEVIHASGVVLDGWAALITGPSGAGKSSLAAALVRDGGQLLSDDAVALATSSSGLIAHAGSVALQLRSVEDERLSPEDRAALGQPAGSFNGRQLYLSHAAPRAAPLGGLFLLERSLTEPAVEQLAAVNPFELIASTFNLSVRTPARLQHQLDVVSAIASCGLAHRLRVQPGVDATRLAALVREHLASVGYTRQESDLGQRRQGRLLEL